VHAALTSNPKQLEIIPDLGAELSGIVNGDGKIVVTSFELNKNAYDLLEETAPRPDVCPRDYDAEEKNRIEK